MGTYSETAVFAQGVGLGASKGKEVSKYAESYKGYAESARESVRYLYALFPLHLRHSK
jgi:RNA-binding protein 5/10